MAQTTKTREFERSTLIDNTGKTKDLHEVAGYSDYVWIESKNDLTAGDGAKHDLMEGKAEWATTTACNVFKFLEACGIKTAFVEQITPTAFVAKKCTMLPYEVITLRYAHGKGSFRKINPHITGGTRLPQLKVEFFLKTFDRKWGVYDLPVDDPYIGSMANNEIQLFMPSDPFNGQSKPFMTLPAHIVFTQDNVEALLKEMEEVNRRVFLCLERAWQLNDGQLNDFKLEYGLDADGNLLLSDVVDNDSWRVMHHGEDVSKQGYRDDGITESLKGKYALVADLTKRFIVPEQNIVLWRGSESDDTAAFNKALDSIMGIGGCGLTMEVVTISGHKSTQRTLNKLNEIEAANMANTVIISFVGMSNGLGPVLAAHTTIPVIAVPASFKSLPNDVYSSLRMPSDCPMSVVISPGNAVLSALNMLAPNNPAIYAVRRLRIESLDNA